MIPQARLQPRAPTSISRTSAWPAVATLSDPVKVRTMIRPNRTSVTRSTGSSTRRASLIAGASIAVREVDHAVGEVPGPTEGLLDGPARIRECAHEAEGEVLVGLPVQ